MEIRKEIQKIIREIFQNEEVSSDEMALIEKAKAAVTALANNKIKDEDILEMDGKMYGDDYREGENSTEGEVFVKWKYEDKVYDTIFMVSGTYDLIKGDEGYWGSSIDDSRAPEPDEVVDGSESINLEDTEVIISDEERNEYDFRLADLEPDFRVKLEKFLTKRYDAGDGTIY
jgi:hypothetical protein